jgi:4-hydroxybenzoate polyprenyltransferase
MSRTSQLVALFRWIRFGEVLVLQGTPFLGVAFSIGTITSAKLAASAVFAAGSFLLVCHIFVFNDWADAAQGINHASGAMAPVRPQGVSPRALFRFSLFLLVASLSSFIFLPPRTFLLAITIAVLGIFYSHPRQNGKSRPIISSFIHFIGGLLHFLLGYALFSEIDQRGVLIGLFFALTFTAGHLNQEVRDFDLDRQVGARTNAVAFGKRRSFFAGMILFALCYAYLFFLAWSGVVPRPLAILAIVLYPLHSFWSIRALRSGLTSESIRRLQSQYRMLYASIGLVMLATLFWR